MKKNIDILKKLRSVFLSLMCVLTLTFPTFASPSNPLTGDRQNIGVVMAIAGAALVVIIVVAAVSAKKGKK